MSETPVADLREREARRDVVRSYAEAYDAHAEAEQLAVAMGDYEAAEMHHAAALICVAGFKREADNPDPPPCPACGGSGGVMRVWEAADGGYTHAFAMAPCPKGCLPEPTT